MQITKIPPELKTLNQWVCWRLVTLDSKDADGNFKTTKHPYNPLTGKKASVTDPSTWVSFEQAVSLAVIYSGIGFVLTEHDPYTIIDLDAPLTDEQRNRHNVIMREFPSYTELSPSGTGVHIVVKGAVHKGVNRDKVEVYSDLRYMTFTGNVLNNLPITEHQYKLNVLMSEIAPPVSNTELIEQEPVISDADLIHMAQNAENKHKFDALCHGDWQHDYKSQSEADAALMSMFCFYTKSNEQVRRLFRQTVLGQREKSQINDRYLDYTLLWIRKNEVPAVDLNELKENAKNAANFQEPEVVPALSQEIAQEQVITAQKPEVDPDFYPPGLTGDIARYIYESSMRPVKEIALITALGIMAGVSGRAYNTYTGAGLNLYLLLLAKTGTGKEEMTRAPHRLFNALPDTFVAAKEFLGAGDFASGQALVKYLDTKPCFLSIFSEFAPTFHKITAVNASSHDAMFRKVLLQLLSKSGKDGVLMETAYADATKNTKTIMSPSLTLLCEAAPRELFDKMNASHIASGFLPRFSIIEYSGGRPKSNRNANVPPSEYLVGRFAELADKSLLIQHDQNVCVVQCTQEAKDKLEAYDHKVDAYWNNPTIPEATLELWNRAHLKVLKISSLLAVGVNCQTPVITLDQVQWAIKFVNKDVNYMINKFATGGIGTGATAQEKAVKSCITKFMGLTPLQKTRKAKARKAVTAGLIPYLYIKQEVGSKSLFENDKMGSVFALDKVLKEMVKSAELVLVDKVTARNEYNTAGVLYGIGDNW